MGLSREALFQYLDVQKEQPPKREPVFRTMLQQAYEHELYWEWREGERSPHGQPWHTSFHASSFPGDNELACGRAAIYTLMDPTTSEPRTPYLQAWFDIGTALEHSWVRRMDSFGALVSANVTAGDEFQTGFEDRENWLTGNADIIMLPRGWNKTHFVEVKTTSHEKVLQMLSPRPSYPKDHDKYLRQLKTYVGLGYEMPYTPTVNICDESGAILGPLTDYVCPVHRKHCAFTSTILEPPDSGELVYSSREEPLTTASFWVTHDPDFMAAGKEKLAQWKQFFLDRRIPEHPREGQRAKWSVDPCTYCRWKKHICKPDYEAGVTSLQDSNLVGFMKEIRPDYDAEAKRSSVLFRWGVGQSEEEEPREEIAAHVN